MKKILFKFLSAIILILSFISCETQNEDIIDPKTLGVWKYFNESNGLTDNYIWDIMEDDEGNIWIGTDLGGVNKYNGTGWESLTTAGGLLDNMVLSIEQDADGFMWFGTQSGLSILTNTGMLNIYT